MVYNADQKDRRRYTHLSNSTSSDSKMEIDGVGWRQVVLRKGDKVDVAAASGEAKRLESEMLKDVSTKFGEVIPLDGTLSVSVTRTLSASACD